MGQNVIEPIGADPTRVGDTTPIFKLGTRLRCNDGREFIYVLVGVGGALTGAGFIGVMNVETYQILQATSANTASKRGWLAGVAMGAMADSTYGWVQIFGPAQLQCLATVAAGVLVNTTVTAGAVDGTVAIGTRTIEGMALTTARPASQGNAAANLIYPRIGITN